MARVLIAEDEPRVALFIEKGLSANDLAVNSCGREQRFRPVVQVAKRVAESLRSKRDAAANVAAAGEVDQSHVRLTAWNCRRQCRDRSKARR